MTTDAAASLATADLHLWTDIAGGTFVGQVPSSRYPIYTRGNAGEVYPEVLYPLSFSMGVQRGCEAGINALLECGAIAPAEVAGHPNAVIGVFGGYSYLNLSIVRLIATRTPGQTVEAADYQYYGASDAPAHVVRKGDKNIRRSIAVLQWALRTLKRGDEPQMDRDAKRVEEWRTQIPNRTTATDQQLLDVLYGSMDLFAELFEHHLIVSNKAAVPIGVLSQICAKADANAQIAPMLSGIGGVQSAAPASALWRLGRTVKSSPQLTALFDAGLSGLEDRLRADEQQDVVAWVASFDGFLEEFGSRGPNEWETACDTWGTVHALPLAIIDRLRGSDDSHDPAATSPDLARQRDAAIAAMRSKLGRMQRKRFDQALAAAGAYSQRREQAKTTVIRALHESRLILLELDARIRSRSGVGEPKDIWFVTQGELDAYVKDPVPFQAAIKERRDMRELLSTREPPFIINGVVPPFDTWVVRGAAPAEQITVGQTFPGIGGCAGVARGRAVVVLDPADPRDIGPGDVLVAPFTDPSWTPLFLAAEAVVVDVGALLSHAVIVSRELGIPCAVSVTGATRNIPDGALIEVDGTSGKVTVIQLP